ncbi:uncharacterized protein TNCV_209731 [Trichonephila clavipes]|uniref:Uncharacterized protein n=1 Tax=Trichonephila clavipes TaxID=2585209 RepID=A0A8X6SY70_TRICX|nr:uncharacterized protein TNCV_209731 [Trichonephila clavipes]
MDGRVVNRYSENFYVLMLPNEWLMIRLRLLVGYFPPYNRTATRPFPLIRPLSSNARQSPSIQKNEEGQKTEEDPEEPRSDYTRAFGDVILNHGQVTWTTPELAPHLLTTTPHQREDVSALDRFNVHRCPTRRVFSGTGFEPVTKQATVRYLYHSATAASHFQSDP